MPAFRFSTLPRLARLLAVGVPLAGLAAFRLVPPDEKETLRHIVLSVSNFYKTTRPETAYLHLDKDVYTAGETVWLRAYVADAAQHQLDTLSKVLYVELISSRQQLIATRRLELSQGLAAGDVALPDSLAAGTYLLRAYTNWMRNAGPAYFYTRRVQVWPATEPSAVAETRPAFQRATEQARQQTALVKTPPDIQFFAEGGNLVAGLDNVVAFKALDYANTGVAVSGQVVDGDNRLVASFSSRHAGMGTLHFTPAAGQRYYAVATTAGAAPLRVPLPAVQASGYVLQVVPTAEAFEVSIRQHGGSGGPILLLGQVGGTVGYLGQGRVAGGEVFAARIPKSKFAAGIVHFTLFDGQGRPLAERLAFAPETQPLHVTLTADQPAYGPHQPVRVHVAVADAAGLPVATQLSLAVADAAASSPLADNIAARLLLTADLAGYVEDPGYYFQANDPAASQALDDLLLTQGWRRFAWEPVLAGKLPAPDYGVERSLSLAGQVTRNDGQPAANSLISFLQAKPRKTFFSATTDAEGRFLFTGFSLTCDTIQATLQARNERGKRNVRIALDEGPAVPAQRLPPLPLVVPPALASAVGRGRAQQAAERQYLRATGQNIRLDTVAVTGHKAVLPDLRRPYNSQNIEVVKMDNIASAKSGGTTVLQALQGRVAGLSITGQEPNIQVSMRGNRSFSGGNSPLIFIDGARTTLDALAFYQASDVESVEILRPGQATIFGSDGSNGVLAIFTRRGNPNYDRRQDAVPGVLALRLPGYNCPREFYAPRYGAGAPALTRPDLRRTTLYWNPSIRTNATGEADLTFYTSAAGGSYRLSAEGISQAGQPALGTGLLEVRGKQ